MNAQQLYRSDADRLLDGEAWLARRLSRHGILIGRRIFEGLTDSNIRKERIRNAILEHKLTDVAVKGPLTYGGAFHRLYGEHL